MIKSFSLSENEYRKENSFLVEIPVHLVQVLKQSRSSRSKENLSELINSIKSSGQETPGSVYAFNKEEADKYLQELNDLWDMDYKISDFFTVFVKEKEEDFYFFLIAGEGRLIACRELGVDYVTKISFGKTFKEGIKWQLAENIIREELSQFDAVNSAVSFWVKLKKKNEKLTLKKFSEEYIGKSVSWLSSAIRFSRLPISIQEMMKGTETEKGVNYSILLAFTTLYDYSVSINKAYDEETLKTYINHCVSHKYNIKKTKEFCLTKQQELDGQSSMFPPPENYDLNRSTLSRIKIERTKDMTSALSYINATGRIKKWISDNCFKKAETVVELIQKEE
ncbi:MAG: hypothetical protein WCO35_02310 [Candidatus Nomurabacteria bacterium]